MEKDNFAYLYLILDSITKIKEYIVGMDSNTFTLDNKTKSAVLMQLQVIGEMSKKLPSEVKSEIHIPWKQIAGLRDMVSHDYFSLDMQAIWKTVTEAIPDAEIEIRKYLTVK